MEEGVRLATDSSSGSFGSSVDKGSWLAPYQFKPGQSGNPRGAGAQGHTLAAYVRSKTLEGKSLIDFLVDVFTGGDKVFSKMSDRLFAAKLLLDRGWGQAPQTITFEKDAQNRPLLDLTKLTLQEFEQFKSLALKIAPEPPKADDEPKAAENPSTNPSGPTISPPLDSQQGGKP